VFLITTTKTGNRNPIPGLLFISIDWQGTASLFLNRLTNPKCQIFDQNMSNGVCNCAGAPPAGPSK